MDPLDEEVPLYAEFFQGFNGDKEPDIDMNFDEKIWKNVIETTKTLSGVQDAMEMLKIFMSLKNDAAKKVALEQMKLLKNI